MTRMNIHEQILDRPMCEMDPMPSQTPFVPAPERTALFAANGFDMALSTIERMQLSLLRAAELFREEKTADANRYFSHCQEGLERFQETVTLTRAVLKLDFTKIGVENRTLSQVDKEFSQILKSILVCQEASDWQGIADCVEYELITNLSSWTNALRLLRLSQHSNA